MGCQYYPRDRETQMALPHRPHAPAKGRDQTLRSPASKAIREKGGLPGTGTMHRPSRGLPEKELTLAP